MSSYENYDPSFPDQPVVDLYLPLWAHQPAFRSKPAFIWADDSSPKATTWSSLTYSQLNSSVQSIASQLLFPLRRGDTILILLPPGLHLVKIIFASQRAGLVSVPVIPPDPRKFSPESQTPAHHHLLRAISQARPNAVVADPKYIDSIKSTTDRLSRLLRNLRWLSVQELENDRYISRGTEYSGCKPDETYLVQYTSGATGIPKPVLVTAGAAAYNVRSARRAYDLEPSSVIVSWLPQYHDCGLMFLLLTVVAGATCVLTSPAAFLNRPRIWLELVTEFKATCTPVPSFALPLVARRGRVMHGKLPLDLGSLRSLVLINEPLYESLVEDFLGEFASAGLSPSSVAPSYGLAENCTFVSTSWQRIMSDPFPSYKKLLPSAKLASPDGDIEIIVVDEETCDLVEDGVEGEIWVSSPSNASSYLHHPSLTREVFNARLRRTAGPCYVRTGDRGVVRGKERYLYVLGRSSDVIVEINGCHPHYLETAAYNSSPMNLRGGCVAAFGVGSEVVVVAELLSKRGDQGEYGRICGGIRDGVRKEEGVEVGMVVLVSGGSVPKTTSGKLRRWAAKDKLLQGKFPVAFELRFGKSSRAMMGQEVGDEVAPFSGSGGAGSRRSLLSFL